MNCKTTPKVNVSRTTWPVPNQSSRPTLVALSNSTTGKNTLNAQIDRMLASRWAALMSAKALASDSWRLKAWTMCMPVTCSWTNSLIWATRLRTSTKALLM